MLDTSLRQISEFESLTPGQQFDSALRQIALEQDIPADQLKSTLDIYAAKVKALGAAADSLDRVLVAQKERQFAQAIKIADQGLTTLEKQDAELEETEKNLRKVTADITQQRKKNLRKRHELLMAKARSLEAQYLFPQAAEAFHEAEMLVDPATLPDLWASARYLRIFNIRESGICATPEEGNLMLYESAELAKEFLKTFPEKQFPESWANAQSSLGAILGNLGKRLPGESGIASLKAAREAYHAALTVYTKEELPQVWATTQNNLGIILYYLGNRLPGESGTDSLKAAREAYQAALTVRTKERLPQNWATTQNNIGNVLQKLGIRLPGEPGTNSLKAAREAYQAALTVRTKEQLPQQWAATQNNLGNVLSDLGTRLPGEADNDLLKAAHDAYQAALIVYTKEQLPQHWALTQNNLGIVLLDLGIRLPGESGTDSLKAAREAYHAALTVHTKEQLPQDWAMTQLNLGSLEFALSQRAQRQLPHIKSAFNHWQSSLEIYTPEANGLQHQRITSHIYSQKASASYTAFLTRDSPLAEEWVRAGLTSKSSLLASNNLAHALLFQGKYEEALALYQKHWDNPEKVINNGTFRQACVADFKEMAEKNLTHSDLPKLKKALGLKE